MLGLFTTCHLLLLESAIAARLSFMVLASIVSFGITVPFAHLTIVTIFSLSAETPTDDCTHDAPSEMHSIDKPEEPHKAEAPDLDEVVLVYLCHKNANFLLIHPLSPIRLHQEFQF